MLMSLKIDGVTQGEDSSKVIIQSNHHGNTGVGGIQGRGGVEKIVNTQGDSTPFGADVVADLGIERSETFQISRSFFQLGMFSYCCDNSRKVEGVVGLVSKSEHISPLGVAIVLEHRFEGSSWKTLSLVLKQIGGGIVDGNGADTGKILFKCQTQVSPIETGLGNVEVLGFDGFNFPQGVSVDFCIVLGEINSRLFRFSQFLEIGSYAIFYMGVKDIQSQTQGWGGLKNYAYIGIGGSLFFQALWALGFYKVLFGRAGTFYSSGTASAGR